VIEMLNRRPVGKLWLWLGFVVLMLAATFHSASAIESKEVHVMTSGGFTAPLVKLLPRFEKQTSIHASVVFGPSMGNTPEAIPNRLSRGEESDVIILVRSALDDLAAKGQVVSGSEVDLVRSSIGLVVRAGAPKPDISTVAALKRTLLNARSIAYSDSASGVYVSTEMFQKLGIAERVLPKSKKIEGERVAAVVARGEAEIGFQQISELLGVPGSDFVGPIPKRVQKITIFSAGITVHAKHLETAHTLIRFLQSPEAARVVKDCGLEPIPAPTREGKVGMVVPFPGETGYLPANQPLSYSGMSVPAFIFGAD
jgi:molybdate transport system substrate-binding protein